MVGRSFVLAVLVTGCNLVFPLEVDPLTCPRSYITTPQGNYRIEKMQAIWVDAEGFCEADQGLDGSNGKTHLIVLGDAEELTTVVTDIAPGQEFWLGFSDETTEGSFHWVSEEDAVDQFAKAPKMDPWDNGEPNDAAGENCAQMKTNQKLNDTTCTRTFRFICECDRHAASGF